MIGRVGQVQQFFLALAIDVDGVGGGEAQWTSVVAMIVQESSTRARDDVIRDLGRTDARER